MKFPPAISLEAWFNLVMGVNIRFPTRDVMMVPISILIASTVLVANGRLNSSRLNKSVLIVKRIITYIMAEVITKMAKTIITKYCQRLACLFLFGIFYDRSFPVEGEQKI